MELRKPHADHSGSVASSNRLFRDLRIQFAQKASIETIKIMEIPQRYLLVRRVEVTEIAFLEQDEFVLRGFKSSFGAT